MARGYQKKKALRSIDLTNEDMLVARLAKEFEMTPSQLRSKLKGYGVIVKPGDYLSGVYDAGWHEQLRNFLFTNGFDVVIMPNQDLQGVHTRYEKTAHLPKKEESAVVEKATAESKPRAPRITLDQVLAADLSSVKVNAVDPFEEIFGSFFNDLFGKTATIGQVELSNMIFEVERVRLVFHFEGGVRKFEYAKRKLPRTKTVADLVENVNLHIKAAAAGVTGEARTLKFSIVVPDGRLIPVKGGTFSALHLRLDQVRWP